MSKERKGPQEDPQEEAFKREEILKAFNCKVPPKRIPSAFEKKFPGETLSQSWVYEVLRDEGYVLDGSKTNKNPEGYEILRLSYNNPPTPLEEKAEQKYLGS